MISRRIKAAVEKLERNGVPVLPETVLANISWRDMTHSETEPILVAALRRRVKEWLKRHHYIIGDERTHERFQFWGATREQLQTQAVINRDNRQYVEAHEKAFRMVLDLLEEKERDLGYTQVPALLYEEIQRIYAMHGLEPPK